MRRSSVLALSIMLALGSASSLMAKEVTINTEEARKIVEITPYDLVTASYQGRFTDDGIPSGGRFFGAVRANKIQAEDLVETAIARGRLPQNAIEDRSYLRNVRFILDNLDKN